MLSVILAALKLIGIILAALLGLLLVLLLMLGFMPITYRGDSACKDCFKSANTASWLFGIFGFKFGYDKGPYAVLRIFTKRIDFFAEDDETSEADEFKEYSSDEASDTHTDKEPGSSCDIKNDNDEGAADKVQVAESIEGSRAEGEAPDDRTVNSQADDRAFVSSDEQYKENQSTDNNSPDINKDLNKKKKKRNRLSIIVRIKKRIKAFKAQLLDKLKNIKDKKDAVIGFIKNPANKRLFRFLRKSLKRLFKHVLPRRTKGYVLYGFDDPYYTGKLLSYISLFSVAYNKNIRVIPAFDKQVMEFDFNYKGCIQPAVVIYILLRVWFDKDFKRVYNEYKNR